jgi:Fe-S cluster biogenesis protein NfuA
MPTRLSKLLKPIQAILSPAAAPEAAPAASPVPAPAPVAVNHAFAPEPNAVKLQVSRPLLPLGESRAYGAQSEAGESPLAQALFALGGVEHVAFDSASVTVLMAEDADWDALLGRVTAAVKEHLEAGRPAVNAAAKKFTFGFKQAAARSPEEQFKIVEKLFEDEINPAVAAHGGHFTLLDVRENRVFVRLGGGCQGCGMVDATLRQGVEQRIKQALPEIVGIIDVTDHAAGENPYYKEGHEGHGHPHPH